MALAPLHVHSCYSLLSGVARLPELVGRARQLGYRALALADVETTSGLIQFLEECRRQGVKPILGVELRDERDPERRVVLLARNAAGYGDLCELTTFHLVRHPGRPLPALFVRPFPDLHILTPHPGLLEELARTAARPSLFGELIAQDGPSRDRSRALLDLCRREGIPPVAGGDVWFLEPQDWEFHRLLRAIDRNTALSRLGPVDHAPAASWMLPEERVHRLFERVPDALENVGRLVGQCVDDHRQQPWILPTRPVPAGHTPDSYLAELAFQGLEANYGGRPERDRALALQQKELSVIASTGYASYFLMVREIREQAGRRFQAGYRRPRECTIMRGSAANCLTFYNLGASDLDPLRYGLYFERFLNEDRTSPPDADLDFGWDEREHALRYFFDTYGEDHVVVLCAIHHFRWRSAFREMAKVHGFSEAQATDLLARIRRQRDFTAHISWRELAIRAVPEIAPVIVLADRLEGMPHFLGQHPGGVIVTEDPIWRHLSCQKSGDRTISQIDMHGGIDFLGLVKFDILGNGSLSVLRDALAQLEEQGVEDPAVWDLDRIYADPQVQALMREGGTRGVFYLESPAQMRLNRKARAETFEEIGITSSLVRPAGTAYAKVFVQRHRQAKEGRADWDFLHPRLAPLLGETHDVCVFQEDVTRICVEVAGLTFADADRVRKMMNSLREGVPAGWTEIERKFLEGCARHSGLSADQAATLWERVASFSGFSFCKSHSLSYAQLSFRCAFLKCHFPAQFMAAVISNQHGFYGPAVYVDEARRLGLSILPLDVNASRWQWIGSHGALRPGFVGVLHLPEAAARALVAERERGGPYRGVLELARRNPLLRRRDAEILALAGAFDSLVPNRVQALALLGEAIRGGAGRRAGARNGLSDPAASRPADRPFPQEISAGASSRPALQGPGTEGPGADPLGPELFEAREDSTAALRDHSPDEKCRNELRYLGFSVTRDALEALAHHPAMRGTISIGELPTLVGRSVRVAGVAITRRGHRVAHSGEPMFFVTLQNATGVVDIVFWPDSFRRNRIAASEAAAMLVEGLVEEDDGTWAVAATRVRAIDPWAAAV